MSNVVDKGLDAASVPRFHSSIVQSTKVSSVMRNGDLKVYLKHPLTVAFAQDNTAELLSSFPTDGHAAVTLQGAEVDLCGLQILLAAARSAAARGGSLGLSAPCPPGLRAKLAASALLDPAASPGPFRFIEGDPA